MDRRLWRVLGEAERGKGIVFNVLPESASKSMNSAYTCICTHSHCTHVHTHMCTFLCPTHMGTCTYMDTRVFESQEESQRGELSVGS